LKFLRRIRRKTPAVTRVDECTKDETGVGAAMAAGSQAENGIWALLVLIVVNRSNRNKDEKLKFLSEKERKFQDP
jgi:hypothetical protein